MSTPTPVPQIPAPSLDTAVQAGRSDQQGRARMRHRAMTAFLLAGTLSLVLGACGGGTSGEGVDPSETGGETSTASSAAPPVIPSGLGAPLVDSGPAPLTSSDPVDAATGALQVWARPELGYQQWWAELRPLMNAQGQQDYALTDPAEIPTLVLTTPPALVEDGPTSALVQVPTSVGIFMVRLSRPDPSVGWLVSRFYFPTPTP